MIVISLYDYTGEAVKPWAKAGYECHCYDIQHDGTKVDRFPSGGSIHYLNADLHNYKAHGDLCQSYLYKPVAFGMAFPVCTDLAVSGAAHFERKRQIDPDFQKKAAWNAMICSSFFSKLRVPFFIENPVSVLSTLWRKPDYMFNLMSMVGTSQRTRQSILCGLNTLHLVMPTLRRLACGQVMGSRCLCLSQ